MRSVLVLLSLVSLSRIASADGRKVTFFHTQPATNEIAVSDGESFKVLSTVSTANLNGRFSFTKDNATIVFLQTGGVFWEVLAPIEVAGQRGSGSKLGLVVRRTSRVRFGL